MERQYYEAQEERARMNSDEYKQQKEEMRKTLWVYSITFTHTLGYEAYNNDAGWKVLAIR